MCLRRYHIRFALLLPLFGAALIAVGLLGGEAHPLAPYVMTALLGAAWALRLIRKEVI